MAYLESIFSLKGKMAVVIGGTGTLCGAIAEGLAGAGAEVVLVGRDPLKAEKQLKKLHKYHGRSYFKKCDVGSGEALEELLDEVCKKSNKVDILINGAGINSATPFLEVEADEVDKILEVNFKGVFKACQVFGRYFVERGKGGSIINVGSMSGLVPLSKVFTYSASKAALHNLSKNLAREWAPQKIRVNTIIPGFFPAEQNRLVLTDERVQQIMNHTPMKRFGEPEELVGVALLLASEASQFITGAEFVVDGGYSAMTI